MENNEQVNKYIHEVVMEKCWHEWDDPLNAKCVKCGALWEHLDENDDNPVYTSDLSPRALLNEVVAATVKECGLDEYAAKLGAIMAVEQLSNTNTEKWSKDLFVDTIRLLCLEAAAEQIARACVAAHPTNAETGCETKL